LVNSNATAQAKAVYNFLIEQYGKKIVSGAMANVNNNNDFADWVYRVTGKYPALTGYDFIHISESWIDYSNITPARTQWNNNGLVTYMWHINAPNSEEDYRSANTAKYGFYIPGKGNAATEFDIREALKEGTWQNEFLLSDIDKVAGVLRLLQDEGIPVLWRPLHEAAGDYRYGPWFWWGRYGDEYVKKLWILLYERLVEHHGLNNLIWVWTAQCEQGYESQMAASYPGDEYVDIVGVDLYPDNDNSQVTSYKAALDMTDGHKLVSLSEVGRIPSPQKCMNDGAYWAWFMEWYTYNIDNNAGEDSFGNTRDAWKQVMASPFVITREQMPNLRN
ncbi:MAG: glycoside hydrolase family 26 protein, partial [Muribaculaceae bacterium]|nr:glycoside hydrolase family 26 protein [Muribaculaceae bacterium]